jgi:hypothetical protein
VAESPQGAIKPVLARQEHHRGCVMPRCGSGSPPSWQGYGLARPMPGGEMEAFLGQWQAGGVAA